MSVYDVLLERGFIEQTTHQEEIIELLKNKKITFYIGFDPTADSLTVGHYLTVMAMAHMQRAGHQPVVLVGGGTAMIGDPTGKTDLRKMMTYDNIKHNVQCFKEQLSKFIDFTDDKAIMVDNADWLLNLNYVEFLREVGVHFSVNRMLTADCYRSRYERGLTFLEFNYMLMQSYDFLELNRRYDCVLQLGGNDQWSNILGGVDLIRRKEKKDAFGMTFTLLTTSDGRKMGKTESGAIWLDPVKTSPYDFYQYWRNIEDTSVERCLALLTFLPMDEVRRLGSLKDSQINQAKEVLAFELTKMIHGEEEATKVKDAAKALFGGGGNKDAMPTVEVERLEIQSGMDVLTLLARTGIVPSKAEARRLVIQGGVTVKENKISDINHIISINDFEQNELLIQKGKKSFYRVIII
jgi:tyrosyl-tRNA synthetase